MTFNQMQKPEYLKVERVGRLGHIELNRPQALNALSLGMLQELRQVLHIWERDQDVAEVVITGAGERAFCAGADVKQVYLETQLEQAGRINDGEVARESTSNFGERYFRCEYELDYCISRFGKPYLAYMDGITMGGGVGVSVLGNLRLATDRTVLAMPETGIGFFPDVGASYFLSRLGAVGMFLALTGQSIDGRTALELGLATHYLEHEQFEDFWRRTCRDGLRAGLSERAITAVEGEPYLALRELADQCFSKDSVQLIMDSLEREAARSDSDLGNMAATALTQLEARSPVSLEVTFEAFRRGRELSLRDCLQMDYRICTRMLRKSDFYEGVRAVLVDKDKSPNWQPRTVAEVDSADVLGCFESLGDDELQFMLD